MRAPVPRTPSASVATSHWACTILVVLLGIATPDFPTPRVVEQWGAVIGSIVALLQDHYVCRRQSLDARNAQEAFRSPIESPRERTKS